ncbi:hypothetical protein BGW80DRAFT_1448232 [Lactifluus volemus]|nr:hypothetical protein BGW80DRAFT_1448232 [Lactifluus volemus]
MTLCVVEVRKVQISLSPCVTHRSSGYPCARYDVDPNHGLSTASLVGLKLLATWSLRVPLLSPSAPPTATSGVLVVIRPERHLRSVATDMLTLAMWIKVLAELVVVVASLDGMRDDVGITHAIWYHCDSKPALIDAVEASAEMLQTFDKCGNSAQFAVMLPL